MQQTSYREKHLLEGPWITMAGFDLIIAICWINLLQCTLPSSSIPFLFYESKNQFRRQKSTIHKRMCGQWRHLINLQSSCAVLLILFHHARIMLAKKRRRWLININSFSKVVLNFFITSLQLNSSQVVEKRKTEGNDLWWKTEMVVQSAEWFG